MNPNPTPKLNEAQSQAVTAPGSVAVIAGAGTGKTTVLGERYLFHLQQYSPLQILALTYTDAAAAELRQRVMQRVRSEHPDSPRLLAEIQAAPILTFHAFCQKIILENPIEAGLPANFTLLETVQDPTWLPGQIERAMAQLDPADLRHFGVSLLKKVIAEYSQDPMGVLEAVTIDLNELEERFNRERGDQLARLAPVLEGLKAVKAAIRDKYPEIFGRIIGALECIDVDPGRAKELLKGLNLKSAPRASTVPEMKIVKELRDGPPDNFCLIYLQWGSNRQDLTILRRVVEKVDQQLRQTKVEWGRLEFADLERHALEALENLDVQKRYRERYPVCLVDEFQDTNPVQVRLLRWLNPDKLTIVGDPQQSIYSFRRANPRLLSEMAAEIVQGGGLEVTLTITHRYHHRIAHDIDPLFKRLWDEYEGMQTRRDPPVPELNKYVISQEKPGNASESCKLQAQEVVRQIRELQKEPIRVHEKGQTVPVEYRDIAVLSRTWAPLQELAEILEKEGIPVTQPAEGSLLDTPVGQDAQALLAFLDNTNDDLALATVLRSPFFALTDAQIASLARREEKIRPRVWTILQNREEFSKVYQILQQLRDQASKQPAVRLLRLADRLTGYSAVLAGIGVQNNGLTRDLADWRGLLQWAMEQPMGHPGALARRMDQLKQANLRVPRPPIEGGNAVTLSTIHSAKGLEWPVVFLFDLSRKAPSYSPRVIFSQEWGLAIKHERLLESLYRVIELRRKQGQEEEEKRLLYVAMTRARDYLYLLGGNDTGLWKHIVQMSPDRLSVQ